MAKTIIGKKIGMTQIFTEEGVMIPVSVIQASPNKVIQIKTKETDGYDAVQIGFMDLKESRANKPTKGHFERWGAPLKKIVKEVRLEEGEAYSPGQDVAVTDFEEGKLLDVTGTSKGKGTQGNIKRHGHHRGPMSHGTKHMRLPGALAAGTYPSRVFKGNDGPGRMGRDTVTVQNVELVKIIPERDIMLIKGAIPGGRGGVVVVQYAVKAGYPDDVRLAAPTEVAEPEAMEEPEIIEEDVVEEPVVEEPVVEEAAPEEAKAEEPATEEAVAEPTEEAAPEEPAEEEPAVEEPTPEEEASQSDAGGGLGEAELPPSEANRGSAEVQPDHDFGGDRTEPASEASERSPSRGGEAPYEERSDATEPEAEDKDDKKGDTE